MAGNENRYGLKRSIPSDVAKMVRKRCGFGCVVCGSAIYDYEHFNPEFKDANFHDPNGIILLCPNHHRTKGSALSLSRIKQFSENPFCRSKGFSHLNMDVENLIIKIGPMISDHCMTALSVNSPIFINEIMMSGSRIKWLPAVMIQNDQKVIWFEPPEEQGAPLRLNMFINDQHQNKIIWIDNNVWHASSDSFDIKIVNKKSSLKIIVSNESGVPIVDINFFAPDTIVISKFISHFSDKSVEIGGSTDSGYINVNGRNMITGSNIYAGYGNIALNIG